MLSTTTLTNNGGNDDDGGGGGDNGDDGDDRQDRNGDGIFEYEDQQRFLSIFNRTRCRRRRGRCPFETNVACPTAAAVGFGQHLLLGIVPMVSVPISGVPTGADTFEEEKTP